MYMVDGGGDCPGNEFDGIPYSGSDVNSGVGKLGYDELGSAIGFFALKRINITTHLNKNITRSSLCSNNLLIHHG